MNIIFIICISITVFVPIFAVFLRKIPFYYATVISLIGFAVLALLEIYRVKDLIASNDRVALEDAGPMPDLYSFLFFFCIVSNVLLIMVRKAKPIRNKLRDQ